METSKIVAFLVLGLAVALGGATAIADEGHGPAKAKEKMKEMPSVGGGFRKLEMNSERGKKLFVDKGCVACHAINGVGGKDAPDLSAHPKHAYVDHFDFAARMWNHSQGMTAVQISALGEPIQLTGPELADITAFIHDDALQHKFSEKDLTPKARKMMDHDHADGDHEHNEEGHDFENEEHGHTDKDEKH